VIQTFRFAAELFGLAFSDVCAEFISRMSFVVANRANAVMNLTIMNGSPFYDE